MTKLHSRYGALRLKLMVITVCFALAPLGALGYFLHSQFSNTYEEKISENIKLVAQNKRDAIEMFLDERISQLKNLAYSNSFKDIADQQAMARLFEIIQSNSGSFIDLGIIDSTGQHVAYVGPYPLQDVNYAHEPWFHKVMLKGVFISDVFMGFRNFPHFIIAVRRQEGEQSWVLRATIDSEIFTSLVSSIQTGLKGDAFLVNSSRTLQTPSRFAGPVLAKVTVPMTNPGQEVSIMHWQGKNEDMIAGIVRLPSTDWRLVVAESPTEEMSPMFKTQSIALGLIGLGVVMILMSSYLTTGLVVKKLQQAEEEKALMDATVVQSNKMASLGKLAAGVAHELNNPLTIIREGAGWIRDIITDGELGDSPTVDDLAQAVTDIDHHVERARKVIHRMLGFARRMEPFQEKVDLNALTRQTCGFLESETLNRDIDVVFELEDALPSITTDASQVQQVILNLMENAIDAIGRAGTVIFRTRHQGDNVILSVADTGPGIPREHLSKVFDPFFTSKEVGKGTGLGLAIVYSTMQRLGGEISVTSTPGEGAQFTLVLPIQHSSQRA